MRYHVTVIETRSVTCRYTVEAPSPEKARAQAEIGNTIDEQDMREDGVLNRTIYEVMLAREAS